MKRKVIYKITYPNGKIYIGKDLTNSLTYFGSPDEDLVSRDFTEEEKKDFTIRKQILWSCEGCPDSMVNKKEVELIVEHRSNDPKIGYNRLPKYRG